MLLGFVGSRRCAGGAADAGDVGGNDSDNDELFNQVRLGCVTEIQPCQAGFSSKTEFFTNQT